MKTTLIVLTVLLLAIGTVAATGVVPPKSPDNECQNNGFEFGIVKWDWNGTAFMQSEEGVAMGYSVGISGDGTSADWTSVPGAAGALAKTGLTTQVFDGGESGTVTGSDHSISHVTLCGNTPEVPEFSAIAAGIVMIAGIGLVILRRR